MKTKREKIRELGSARFQSRAEEKREREKKRRKKKEERVGPMELNRNSGKATNTLIIMNG